MDYTKIRFIQHSLLFILERISTFHTLTGAWSWSKFPAFASLIRDFASFDIKSSSGISISSVSQPSPNEASLTVAKRSVIVFSPKVAFFPRAYWRLPVPILQLEPRLCFPALGTRCAFSLLNDSCDWPITLSDSFIPVTDVLGSSLAFSALFFSLCSSSISSWVSGPSIQSNGEYHLTKSSNKQPGFAACGEQKRRFSVL